MSTTASRRRRAVKRDLANPRACRTCGKDIALLTVLDLMTHVARVVLVDPVLDPTGWNVVDDVGRVWFDNAGTMPGDRYHTHRCPGRNTP